MNELGKYAVYFLLGGTIVSVSTYLGAQGRPYLAAFASTFPAITGATFLLLYSMAAATRSSPMQRSCSGSSRRGSSMFLAMIFIVPRLGFWPAMTLSLVLYMGCVWLVRLAVR